MYELIKVINIDLQKKFILKGYDVNFYKFNKTDLILVEVKKDKQIYKTVVTSLDMSNYSFTEKMITSFKKYMQFLKDV